MLKKGRFMRITKLSFVMVCVIFAVSSFQGIAYSQNQVVVVPLISNRLQGISPNDVVQLGTNSCTVNRYCGMGLRCPEEGLNFSGGVPEGKYLVINSVSIQPANPGAGVMQPGFSACLASSSPGLRMQAC
jgi:hypothetical protein